MLEKLSSFANSLVNVQEGAFISAAFVLQRTKMFLPDILKLLKGTNIDLESFLKYIYTGYSPEYRVADFCKKLALSDLKECWDDLKVSNVVATTSPEKLTFAYRILMHYFSLQPTGSSLATVVQ
jgi:hypothetical protein